MLTKYGRDNILIMLGAGSLLILFGLFFFKGLLELIFIFPGALLIVFTFVFFRDPERKIPAEAIENPSFIISPADGKIVEIQERDEDLYLKSKALQISIFLSPLDVHVNRCPVSGLIEFFKYTPGDYLVAYHPKSSELNEQTIIGVNTGYGRILFKQIVGIVARRLVCELKLGDCIKPGERFGMMKFGSRMDILIPTDTEIYVRAGDRVRGGETLIGKLTGNQ